jgi:hypothetical protein
MIKNKAESVDFIVKYCNINVEKQKATANGRY